MTFKISLKTSLGPISNSSKDKILNLNSSIRKYLNLNIDNKQNLEFTQFQKTPLRINKSIHLKKENLSPMRTPAIKQENQSVNANIVNANEANFSAFSKMSYDSQIEEINFDHCQYIEIMQNMQKGPIKLYSKTNEKSKKSLKLLENRLLRPPIKREISDFASFAPSKFSLNKGLKKKMYMCKYCHVSFSKPCALGGHMSKMHKGRSPFFKQRKEKREMRETERQRNTFFKTIFRQNC